MFIKQNSAQQMALITESFAIILKMFKSMLNVALMNKKDLKLDRAPMPEITARRMP